MPWTKHLDGENICSITQLKNALSDFECYMSVYNPNIFSCKESNMASNFSCENLQSCKQIKMDLMDEFKVKNEGFNDSTVLLLWKEEFVTYIQDFVAYDLQNFIGEVGGTLGLFLGVSFTSLITFIEYLYLRQTQ